MSDPVTTVQCAQCQTRQNANHLFCCHCGHELSARAGADASPLQQIEQSALDSLKRQTHQIELETVENIQDRSIKWIKSILFIMTLFVLAGTWFGIREAEKLKSVTETAEKNMNTQVEAFGQKFDKLAEQANLQLQAITAKIEAVNKHYDEADKSFNKLILESNKILAEAHSVKSEIDALDIKSTKQEIESLKMLQADLKNRLEKAKLIGDKVANESRNVEKLGNSLFSISVHIDSSEQNRESNWALLVAALDERGFQLSTRDRFDVEVRVTEVVYFHEFAEKQAKQIAAIIRDEFATRMLVEKGTGISRNPREILVKLKLP
jgi:hypothetical protein